MFDEILSAEEFCDRLPGLPEAGRWCELVRGQVVVLDPPSQEHGAIVLNLARVLGTYCMAQNGGYACFDTRLVTQRAPDTVRRPAVTYFATGARFAEIDAPLSERTPRLVIEVVSSRVRRRQLFQKLEEYHAIGTRLIWSLDLDRAAVEVRRPGKPQRILERDAVLREDEVLQGFRCDVASLFQMPKP